MSLPCARTRGARLSLAGAALAAGLAVAVPAVATPLTLGEAIDRALAANPALAGFAYALRAEEARIAGAGQWAAPGLSLEVENALGSGDFGGLDAAEITLALSQVIELGDQRALRTAAARSAREVVAIEQAAAQLDVVAEVSRRFLAVAVAAEQVQLAGEAVGLARETVADVERRVRAARSPEGELKRAEAALGRAGLDEERAIGEHAAARDALAATWGATRADFEGVAADLYRQPDLLGFEALATRLEANPDFLRFTTEARLRDAELRVARARRRGELELSGGVRRFEESGDQALVFGVAVPLFAGRSAAPAVAEAEAARARIDADREAARLATRTQLRAWYQQLEQARRESAVLAEDILPRLEAALGSTRYAYERGRYGYAELLEAQREFLAGRRDRIAAAALARELLVEIERLTGEPLTTPATLPEEP